MLTRVQNYLQANPLPMWLYAVSFFSAVYTLANHFMERSGHIMMPCFACQIFVQPTIMLLTRSSDEARRQHPFPPQQERIIGWVAACAAAVSMASVGTFLAFRLFGVKFGDGIFTLLGVFVFSTLFAMAMGYAARRTKVGYWSAITTTCLFSIIVAIELVAIVLWWNR